MFHDLNFVFSDVEINFFLGQKQTVLNVLLAGTIVTRLLPNIILYYKYLRLNESSMI